MRLMGPRGSAVVLRPRPTGEYYHDTRWEPCNEQTADRFSAIAMAFGHMLSDSLGVPVSLISNAVSGSPAEAWIDRKTVEFEFPDLLYD